MRTNNGLILGIDTSCDVTGVALVEEEGTVVSSASAIQAPIHLQYGGVYPEAASRAHIDNIVSSVRIVIEHAGIDPRELAAIGVSRGPGLIGSLMVGLDTAAGLAHGWGVPLLGINHLHGHLRSQDLERPSTRYPALILLNSAGHTLIAHVSASREIRLVSKTLDNAVSDAYDKVARMLVAGYPGGPVLESMARRGEATIPFPRPLLRKGFELSFSGLITATKRYLDTNPGYCREDVAASFVSSCTEVLITKFRLALARYPSESLTIIDGLSADSQLRIAASELCADENVEMRLPSLKWATDNGAMVAMAAWDYVGRSVVMPATPNPSLAIGSL